MNQACRGWGAVEADGKKFAGRKEIVQRSVQWLIGWLFS